jgi:hypothetical protein
MDDDIYGSSSRNYRQTSSYSNRPYQTQSSRYNPSPIGRIAPVAAPIQLPSSPLYRSSLDNNTNDYRYRSPNNRRQVDSDEVRLTGLDQQQQASRFYGGGSPRRPVGENDDSPRIISINDRDNYDDNLFNNQVTKTNKYTGANLPGEENNEDNKTSSLGPYTIETTEHVKIVETPGSYEQKKVKMSVDSIKFHGFASPPSLSICIDYINNIKNINEMLAKNGMGFYSMYKINSYLRETANSTQEIINYKNDILLKSKLLGTMRDLFLIIFEAFLRYNENDLVENQILFNLFKYGSSLMEICAISSDDFSLRFMRIGGARGIQRFFRIYTPEERRKHRERRERDQREIEQTAIKQPTERQKNRRKKKIEKEKKKEDKQRVKTEDQKEKEQTKEDKEKNKEIRRDTQSNKPKNEREKEKQRKNEKKNKKNKK